MDPSATTSYLSSFISLIYTLFEAYIYFFSSYTLLLQISIYRRACLTLFHKGWGGFEQFCFILT